MAERYTRYSTVNDVMKEFLIYGAELTKMGYPILPMVQTVPSNTEDFSESLSRKLKGHKRLNVNFFVDDEKFERLYSAPDRYIEHLKCFESICGLDFSIDTQMPLVMQMWNKYRSMALDWYLTLQGIKVIPNVNIVPYEGRKWLLDGIPKYSTVCCSTNGRIRSKRAREEFCDGFYQMCSKLEPTRIIVVGRLPDELRDLTKVINLKARNQRMNERFGKDKYGDK